MYGRPITSEIKKYENKVKGQGQMSPNSNHFCHSPWGIFLLSYIDFRPAVFEIFCGHTDAQTDAAKTIPARSIAWGQVLMIIMMLKTSEFDSRSESVNKPSSQSAVCPIHCVFLQTRCHVWEVKLHVTVALLLMRVTWPFFGGSGSAQPVAVTSGHSNLAKATSNQWGNRDHLSNAMFLGPQGVDLH